LYNAAPARMDGVTWIQMGGSGTVHANHPHREGTPATMPASGATTVSVSRIPNGRDTDMNSMDFQPRTSSTAGAVNL